MLYMFTLASNGSAKSYSIVSHCATTGYPLRVRGIVNPEIAYMVIPKCKTS